MCSENAVRNNLEEESLNVGHDGFLLNMVGSILKSKSRLGAEMPR